MQKYGEQSSGQFSATSTTDRTTAKLAEQTHSALPKEDYATKWSIGIGAGVLAIVLVAIGAAFSNGIFDELATLILTVVAVPLILLSFFAFHYWFGKHN